MVNIVKKIILIALMAVLIVSINNTKIFAAGAFDTGRFEDVDAGEAEAITRDIMGTALNVIRIVAAGVAMIMLLVLSIKYMLASAADRAEIKKHAVIYVVGALLLFATSGIISILQEFSLNIEVT